MEILEDFGVQPILLAAQVVNFTILLIILQKLVYKPVVKLLEERKQKIAEALQNSRKIEEQLITIETEQAKILARAKDDGKKIVYEAKSIADQIKAEADQEAVKRLEAALKKADQAAGLRFKEMEKRLKQDVVTLVVDVLKVTTGKVLTKEDQEKIVAKQVEQITKN